MCREMCPDGRSRKGASAIALISRPWFANEGVVSGGDGAKQN